MRFVHYLLGIGMIGSCFASEVSPSDCPILGDLRHWQADYCMAEIGADDIIAADACLERESQIRFRSPCNGKYRYKHAMCKSAVRAGTYSGSVDGCVQDPLFVGPIVRNGGA
jgi:hypothetical protein